jgi:hypothetical protein
MLANPLSKEPIYGNGLRYIQRDPETNEIVFEGDLKGHRCDGLKKDGTRCTRMIKIGHTFCFQHRKNLKVEDSQLEEAGKGLWVRSKTHGDDEIVFRKGDMITRYNGEIITPRVLKARYGQYTAPYGVELNNGNTEDASLVRGLGSLINHKPTREANCELIQPRGRNYVVIKAKKNIRNNKELFLSYGRQYKFDDHISTTKYVKP